ncbi:hypothetical protein LJB68_03870 [bacterium 210820-DFI.6.52]|nr:hypothetical protein [bacterium 210820-DFI.6.52]
MADSLIEELKNLEDKAKKSKSAVKGLKEEIQKLSSESFTAAKQVEKATGEIEDFADTIEKGDKETKNLGDALKKVGGSAGETSSKVKQVGDTVKRDIPSAIVEITKLGDAMKQGGVDGMSKAAEAGKGLSSALGLIPGAAGTIIPAVAAMAGGIVAAFSEAREAQIQAGLEEHFGKIRISAEEVEKVAKRITTTDWTVQLDAYMDAKGQLDEYEDNIRQAIAEMEKIEWKVSVGMKLTEEDKEAYRRAADTYIEQTSDYLTQKQYTANLNIQLALPEGAAREGLLAFTNQYYTQSRQELSGLADQLSKLVNDGVVSGIFDQDAINEIESKMSDMIDKLSEQNFQAEMDNLQITFKGVGTGYDKESIDLLNKEADRLIKDIRSDKDGMRLEAIKMINLKYDYDIEEVGKEEAERLKKEAMAALETKINVREGQINLQAIQFGMENLKNQYGTELDTAVDDMTKKGQELFGALLKETGGNIFEATKLFESRYSQFTSYLTGDAKKAAQDMLEAMAPRRDDLERIKAQCVKDGTEIPQSVVEGLTELDQLAAIANGNEDVWRYFAQSITDNEEYREALLKAQAGGKKLPEEIERALELGKYDVYDSSCSTWSEVSQASADSMPGVLKNLGVNTGTYTDTLALNLSSGNGEIKKAAAGQWNVVQNTGREQASQVTNSLSKMTNFVNTAFSRGLSLGNKDIKKTAAGQWQAMQDAGKESITSVLDGLAKRTGSVNETMSLGLFSGYENIKKTAAGQWSLLQDAGAESTPLLLEDIVSKTGDINSAMCSELCGGYGEIKDAAIGQWTQVKTAAFESGEQVQMAMTACGDSASGALMQSLLNMEPSVRSRAIGLLNQLTGAEEEKRQEILGQLSQLGISLDNSLGNGIDQNLAFVRNRATGLIDVVNTTTGVRIREVTPEFVENMKAMGLLGVQGMSAVTGAASVRLPKPMQLNESIWSSMGRTIVKTVQKALDAASLILPQLKFSLQPPRMYATGGILTRPEMALVAEEAPGEAIIPLNPARRSRAISLWEETGARLGMDREAIGALNQSVGFSLQREKQDTLLEGNTWVIDYERLGKEVADALHKRPLEVEKVEVQNKNILSVELDGEILGRKTAPTISRILARKL